MVRLARAELFDTSEVAILHVIGRVTRRCFLFGFDPVSGKNFRRRKVWIEEQLKTQAANFGMWKHGETWGHDTFMCGLDFLNLDLRYYPHGLLAKLVTFLYFVLNHSK